MCACISGTSLLYLWMGSTWPLQMAVWHSPGSKWLGWVSAFPQLPSAPSFSASSVLGSREHLFNPASPLQDRAEGQLPSGLPEGVDWSGASLPPEPRLVPGMLFSRWIFATCQTWDF